MPPRMYSENFTQGAREVIERKAEEILRSLGFTATGFDQVDPSLVNRLADVIGDEIQRWD
jgi:hypothetical protein